MDKNNFKTQINRYFSNSIRALFESLNDEIIKCMTEIRLTLFSPVYVECCGYRKFLGKHGLTENQNDAYIVKHDDVSKSIELITHSSVYAYNHHINDGFITLPGGHRVGVIGTCVMDKSNIISVKDINSLNFRLANSIEGVSDIIFEDIFQNGKINNTLIISPPACGKTTLLKDIIRSLNNIHKTKKIIKCVVIDERFELYDIFSSYASDFSGLRSSVIRGCPKSLAIPLVIRSMSPDVIIADELATQNDAVAAKYAEASGCSLIATVHGANESNNEIAQYDLMKSFSKLIILSDRCGPGTLERVIDNDICNH